MIADLVESSLFFNIKNFILKDENIDEKIAAQQSQIEKEVYIFEAGLANPVPQLKFIWIISVDSSSFGGDFIIIFFISIDSFHRKESYGT